MRLLSHLSDSELVDLLKSGDRAAYTEIYGRYIFILLNHAYNKTRNREEAKDIVHEVFATLWTKRSYIVFPDKLSGYLYTSVRNIILNQIERKGVQAKYLAAMQQFAASGQTITDHGIREQQLSTIIEQEIASLPPKMREVFELSRKAYLTHKEIADKLHISEQTVSKHVTNALKILRVKLGLLIYLLCFIRL